jgi:hypothetical protein
MGWSSFVGPLSTPLRYGMLRKARNCQVRHLLGSREWMLIFCHQQAGSVTKEEYELCMR